MAPIPEPLPSPACSASEGLGTCRSQATKPGGCHVPSEHIPMSNSPLCLGTSCFEMSWTGDLVGSGLTDCTLQLWVWRSLQIRF